MTDDKNEKIYTDDDAFDFMFDECVSIPNGTEHIGNTACRWFKMREVAFPLGLKTIGDEAFSRCAELKKVAFPITLKSIGEEAFYHCSALKEVVLSQGINSIGRAAFEETAVESIVIPSTVESFPCCFKNCRSLKKAIIEDGVEQIDASAFAGCTALEEVVLPSTIKRIGWAAFNGCTSLKSIVIPESIEVIADFAFEGCINLERVELPDLVKKIGKNAFKGCKKLPPVFSDRFALRKSVRKQPIFVKLADKPEQFTFFGRDEVAGVVNKKARYTTVYVPDGVRTVCTSAFCELNVKQVILSDGLEAIEKCAFKDCVNFKKIFIPKSVKTIDDDAFLGCKLLKIYCEGEPQDGWLNKPETKRVFYDDMTDAFNFHRSSGSFDDRYIVERVEITHNNFNPEGRPVFTNVSREEFLKLLSEDNDEA